MSPEHIAQHEGKVWWTELITPDVEAAKAHYAAAFGWTYEGVPVAQETYWIAKADGTPVAGLFTGSTVPYKVPPHWLIYFATPDIDAAVERVRDNARILREPFDVPNFGRIAIVQEPGGAAIGFITPFSPEATS